MSLRTDLAMETAAQLTKNENIKGVTMDVTQAPTAGLEITTVKVTDEQAAQRLSKPIGEYITVKFLSPIEDYSDKFEQRVELIAEQITRLAPDAEKILAVGLGNRQITPDAVGPLCADKIFPTSHIKKYAKEIDSGDFKDVTVIQTGVMGQTGIEASEQVSAVCRKTAPDLVVAVDALACSDLNNLGCTVQLCNTGISPGSGVENARKELSEQTLGVSCIAVGVPTVVDMSTAAEQLCGQTPPDNCGGMMVTPRNIDRIANSSAKYIAYALNKAFLKNLTVSDIESLVE